MALLHKTGFVVHTFLALLILLFISLYFVPKRRIFFLYPSSFSFFIFYVFCVVLVDVIVLPYLFKRYKE